MIDQTNDIDALLRVLRELHEQEVPFNKFIICTGSIMRTGRKVTVTRLEFQNDQDKLIAVGTGTYIVS